MFLLDVDNFGSSKLVFSAGTPVEVCLDVKSRSYTIIGPHKKCDDIGNKEMPLESALL